MLTTIEATLIEEWDSLRLNQSSPRGLQFTRVGSLKAREKEGALTFITHADWERHPSLIVKVVKNREYEGVVVAEHRRLQNLRHLLGEQYRTTVPRALRLFRAEGTLVSVREFLDGTPFLGYLRLRGGPLHRRRVIKEANAAVKWLRVFERATAGARRDVPAEEFVSDLYLTYSSQWGRDEVDERLFERLLKRLSGKVLALRPSHGDFCSRNLLISREGLVVIDWTHFHPFGPPLADLVNLLIARQVKGLKEDLPGKLLPLYRLGQKDWFGEYCRSVLREEADRCAWRGVDIVTVIALAVAFAATRSTSEVGPRASPLRRRAEFLRDLALWVTKADA